jgi:hypothetical protein
MGLTHQQHITLSKYLKAVGIKEQEPFEEFYDHIATGFERSQIHDLQHYIESIAEPDFGGTKGMLRIVRNQNKHRRAMIVKRAKEIFVGLFGWPTVLIVFASYLMVITGRSQFGQKFTIIFSLVIGLFVPVIIVLYGQLKFYFDCKKNKLPYTRSNLNSWLISFVYLPAHILNAAVNLIIPSFFGRDNFKAFLASYPWITIVLCTFTILFGYIYLMLIREKFVFKLKGL